MERISGRTPRLTRRGFDVTRLRVLMRRSGERGEEGHAGASPEQMPGLAWSTAAGAAVQLIGGRWTRSITSDDFRNAARCGTGGGRKPSGSTSSFTTKSSSPSCDSSPTPACKHTAPDPCSACSIDGRSLRLRREVRSPFRPASATNTSSGNKEAAVERRANIGAGGNSAPARIQQGPSVPGAPVAFRGHVGLASCSPARSSVKARVGPAAMVRLGRSIDVVATHPCLDPPRWLVARF